MVYRFQITYDEVIELLDLKNIPSKRTNYSLNPGVYELIVMNSTLKHNLPGDVKVCITPDDIKIKSNLNNTKHQFLLKYHFSTQY